MDTLRASSTLLTFARSALGRYWGIISAFTHLLLLPITLTGVNDCHVLSVEDHVESLTGMFTVERLR